MGLRNVSGSQSIRLALEVLPVSSRPVWLGLWVACAALLLCGQSAATAGVEKQAVGDGISAGAKLKLILSRLTRPPKLTDEAAAPHLRTFWNTEAVTKRQVENPAPLPDVMKWSLLSSSLVKLYASGGGAATSALNNLAEYGEEIALGAAFTFRLNARVTQQIDQQQSSLDAEVVQSRRGIATGSIMSAADMLLLIRRMKPADARLVARSYAEEVGVFVPLVEKELLAKLRAAAEAAAAGSNDDEIKKDLRRLANLASKS